MEKIEMGKILRAFIVAFACFPPLALATDLPTTLAGTLINPAGDTIAFGAPSTTATMTLDNHATLLNDGTWNAYAGTLSPNYSYIGPTFASSITNTGTLNINAGTDLFRILDFTTNQPSSRPPDPRPVTFTNTGTINLNTGAFYLAASDSGSTSGTINLAANTTLGLGGTFTFDANSSITGSGNVLLSTDVRNSPKGSYTPNLTNTPPAITFNGDYSITGTTTIYGASVTFNHDVTLNNLQVADPGSISNFNTSTLYAAALTGTGIVSLIASGRFSPTSPYFWTGGPSITGSGYYYTPDRGYFGTTLSVRALVVRGTLNLSVPIIDGTAITIAPGAAMAVAADLHFENHATIINNGLLVANNAFGRLFSLNRSFASPAIVLTNNNMIYVGKDLGMGVNTEFNNNGTVLVAAGAVFQPQSGTDSKTSVITVMAGARMIPTGPRTFTGTFNNAGNLQLGTDITLSQDLTFNHTGLLEIRARKVLLAAPQQAATTGTFAVDSILGTAGILEFAADYDFSSPTGPSLTHYGSADGLIIIDPGITLTLPLDTAFAGTIQVDGTLIIAPPLDPANINMTPRFTILPAAVPEPTSLLFATIALPLAMLRRTRRPR